MKERLVLNIIDYCSEANKTFETSSFWTKCQNLLIMFYLYEYEREERDFMILDSTIFNFSEKDLSIIKNDWEIIHNKIVTGNAQNISEADTLYLAACTKGKNKESSFVKQPFSNELAHRRAYALKASYLNGLVDEIFQKEKAEQIFKSLTLSNSSFEDMLREKFKPYFGYSEKELLNSFNFVTNNKAKFNLLCGKILGINSNINSSEEFKKANIQLKTIRVEENNTIKEHISFPYFDFVELSSQEFEESDIYKKLNETKFFFVIFKKNLDEYYLNNVSLWNMPYKDILKYVEPVFENTKHILNTGNIVKNKVGNKYNTNFTKPSFNNVCHVRPHDSKGIDKTKKGNKLPVNDLVTHLDRYTKHCFWLDRHYVLKAIEKYIDNLKK